MQFVIASHTFFSVFHCVFDCGAYSFYEQLIEKQSWKAASLHLAKKNLPSYSFPFKNILFFLFAANIVLLGTFFQHIALSLVKSVRGKNIFMIKINKSISYEIKRTLLFLFFCLPFPFRFIRYISLDLFSVIFLRRKKCFFLLSLEIILFLCTDFELKTFFIDFVLCDSELNVNHNKSIFFLEYRFHFFALTEI